MPDELRLLTLNAGRGFPGYNRTLNFLADHQADVVCLQDIRERQIAEAMSAAASTVRSFAPMALHCIAGRWEPVGIAIISRFPFRSISSHAYVGAVEPVRRIEGMRYAADGNVRPVDLARVRETESRMALFVEIETGGRWYKVGTTHGVWTPRSAVDDHQRRCTARLVEIMRAHGSHVMAGDLNAARGGEVYRMIVGGGFTDNVPAAYTNSIDWEVRGETGPDILVDYLFTRGPYTVSDVELHFGVSDHAAVTGLVRVEK